MTKLQTPNRQARRQNPILGTTGLEQRISGWGLADSVLRLAGQLQEFTVEFPDSFEGLCPFEFDAELSG